jgi:hypothetical protein
VLGRDLAEPKLASHPGIGEDDVHLRKTSGAKILARLSTVDAWEPKNSKGGNQETFAS